MWIFVGVKEQREEDLCGFLNDSYICVYISSGCTTACVSIFEVSLAVVP